MARRTVEKKWGKRLKGADARRARNRRYYAKRLEARRLKISGDDQPEIFAICRTYEELIKALQRWRMTRLRMSSLAFDERAGFQTGYTSKLEIGYKPSGRGIGNAMLPIWLEAAGVELAVVPRRQHPRPAPAPAASMAARRAGVQGTRRPAPG